MKKRIFALLLAAMLPLGAAIADEPLTDGTVLVDWVDGQETYTAICSGELTLRYDADTNTYATADGLIWKTEGALPFATYQPLLMPRTREELLQCNAIYAALQDASGFWSEKVTGTEVLPVYAAPDENSYRASNGKASVSLAGGATLLMQYGDWSLVRYEVNSSRMRIGWVHAYESARQRTGDAHGHPCDTQGWRVPDRRPRYKLVSHGGRGHADRRASAGAV